MRLLHAKTLEFEVLHDNEIPRYLILSHTWGIEEISYQEMRFLQQHHALPDSLKSDTTIQKAAKLAREKGLKYIWIDTCCIGKSSSAELQEAINSMYRWYQQSCFCMVHLEDADSVRDPDSVLHRRYDIATILRTSRWITRGWTLQELIAPKALAFYDQDFSLIGSKSMFCPTIAEVTGIPLSVLRTGDLNQASVAQKILMGLFGIHMPMLYGEGDNAFRQLQEEIMRRTPDDSIFAWKAPDGCGTIQSSPFRWVR
ncbi:HET-domain-containing protein [Alternaria alternata]|uniref:HET-domain-containing protein n=1 Tax=Alternaria alternata TaxID=5599 RepID=A0A177D6G2_ALTAL|nr:HET-domain-containing protein [Alternaria alternata]OAG14921.1 HET-domain-containing protein [Alternaria alternata]